MERKRVVIMGAAGRDFHDFNVVYRMDPAYEVVAFTATQIPGIADRTYPVELAGPLYRSAIPILPEADLEHIIREQDVDLVVFAYSDVSYATVMHAASRAMAAGADFELLGPRATMIPSTKPVIAVGATRTGCGKSQTTRFIASIVDRYGLEPVVIRHPMPYGDLVAQRVQRYTNFEDLDRYQTTIEEREEYEPHIDAGHTVYAGVDYAAILSQAEEEADVILWDGGNNDFPFYVPDLFVVVADPLRPGTESSYHPGELNVRMADVLIINKVDSAEPAAVIGLETSLRELNPTAPILLAESTVALQGGSVAGKRVVVVEDGPTLTHGEMTFGAGVVAARRAGAQLVDPRPFAIGSIKNVLAKYPKLDSLVPAMGYGPDQVNELQATLNACDADMVLAATPIDITRVMTLDKPVVRVRYDLKQVGGTPLEELLAPIVTQAHRGIAAPVG
ncbi:MAG TPA: cyclic 2,3-diphosphoglycerate synthase [Candidatus Limnocylindrales bacterium]|jgi:predicted GTPase